MTPVEIARRLAEIGQVQDAQQAYALVLQQEDRTPEEELEAAQYIFFSKGNYRVSYTTFVSLYNRGLFQDELMNLMTQAFYLPNVKKLRRQYRDNCQRLERYPYLFRKEFPDFDQLPIQFFPFDDNGYLPYDRQANRFGDYINFNDPVVDRYFFKNLENPILAKDVYSQYQLEYLNDNVRKSEWIGRENHIYLHYTSWPVFCACLQCLKFQELLRDRKLVLLIEEQVEQYPIDFKARFGIDYSKYPVKPLSISEIKRLIWHTQLSAHNGGDFFNEIFYGHPNLLALESVMFDDTCKEAERLLGRLKEVKKGERFVSDAMQELAEIPNPTMKDALVTLFLDQIEKTGKNVDPAARIVPAIFFQPHFSNIYYEIVRDKKTGKTVLHSKEYERICQSPAFQGFQYIKTFTPMRRPTTSYGATVRFTYQQASGQEGKVGIVNDILLNRLLNRSFMVDTQDRLYRDSVLVRFEDGKLNPKATFTALAEFLDLPYTESMTYCSGVSGMNPESLPGNDLGFDPAAIYRTYDEYVNDADRAVLEYFLRDVYQYYGYDFLYYKGEPVDQAWLEEKLKGFTNLDQRIFDACCKFVRKKLLEQNCTEEEAERVGNEQAREFVERYHNNRLYAVGILLQGLRFVNPNGQPLRFMKQLELDPELLEQPLYH